MRRGALLACPIPDTRSTPPPYNTTPQINYGGRVTDDNDRRLLMCILGQYYTPAVLSDTHSFTASGVYRSPPAGDHAAFLAHIKALPQTDEPEVFGLHANAAITFNLQEARKLIDTVLSIQPRVAAAAPSAGAAASSSGPGKGKGTKRPTLDGQKRGTGDGGAEAQGHAGGPKSPEDMVLEVGVLSLG